MLPRHILRVDQFDRMTLDHVLGHARAMRQVAERGGDERLSGKILATLFYEPSTRTRLSFESAMLRLGGQVISAEDASETSSAVKGESIEDTVRIVESYADAIVIRHPLAGTPERGAAVASVPIVNAGDGAREHPTQALLDLLTISEELGRIDDLTVAMVGDLRYGRAPRSLAMLLGLTRNCRLNLVAPPGIEMAGDVLRTLSELGVGISFEPDLMDVASDVDVIYVTRVQRERFPSDEAYRAARGSYRFTTEHLRVMKRDSIVMHPLPRLDEVDPGVDADPRSAYFRQARNGVFMRMALLDLLLQPSGVLV
ncbi:MAG TPA: aspartate carbamoyltransferase [Thermomicrobiales bacterium]|nr:aspartate carbamoyltransferase [Thermomicrobiales bacterium]